MMKNLTAEQAEQRETLLSLGYVADMIDNTFEPSEWAMLIQESLLDDLTESEDQGDY